MTRIHRTSLFHSSFTRTWLRYVRAFAIANPSVVRNVRAPCVENFGNIYSPFCILAILWGLDLRAKFYGDRPRGTLPRRGVKCKRGSKIERYGGPIEGYISYICHVRVSHLLISFLYRNTRGTTLTVEAHYDLYSVDYLNLRIFRLISWNLTTRCLTVTCGGSIGECGRLSQPSSLWSAL